MDLYFYIRIGPLNRWLNHYGLKFLIGAYFNWFEARFVMTLQNNWCGIFHPTWHPLEAPKIAPFI